LTQRQNTTRTQGDENAANRRIFYDFTFSPAKSVSLAGFLGNDERIGEAHARAVQAALKHFEAFAATRVRVGGARSERLTRNFIASKFTHDTSRPLDPHLHTDCIVFNATFDTVENRWKALENYELLRARKFAENIYYHELARELKASGYRVRNRPRGDFEIEEVSEELCKRFSKRDAEIDAALAKLLTKHPELATEKRTRKQNQGAIAAGSKDKLGAGVERVSVHTRTDGHRRNHLAVGATPMQENPNKPAKVTAITGL